MKKQEQTHWKKLTNPNYIGAYIFSDTEREKIFKIKNVTEQHVQGGDGNKELCIVAELIGSKPFILNKTNCKAIERMYGTPYIEDWAGKLITVYVQNVKAFGSYVDALRVKTEIPVVQLPELTKDLPAWKSVNDALKGGKFTIKQVQTKFYLSKDTITELAKLIPTNETI